MGRLTFKTGSGLRVQCSGLLYWKLARFPLYLDNCARLRYTASRPLSGFKQPNVWVKLGLSTYLKGELTQRFEFCHLLSLISQFFCTHWTQAELALYYLFFSIQKQWVIVAVWLTQQAAGTIYFFNKKKCGYDSSRTIKTTTTTTTESPSLLSFLNYIFSCKIL